MELTELKTPIFKEVKAGFKISEVGLIPEDWLCQEIGKVLRIRHGKSQKQVLSTHGPYPILGTGGPMGLAKEFIYNKESVLIGRKGTIDKPRYMSTPFWTVDTLFYSEIYDGFSPKFIYYIFLLIDWYSYNEASGVPSLSANTIESIKIALPPTLREQKTITTTLSDVDDLITSLEKLIAKKKAIKQGAMQQLLIGKIRLKGFEGNAKSQQTELGSIPEDWRMKRLGTICGITKLAGFEYSLHFNSYNDGGDIIVVRGTNITHNKMNLADVKTIPTSTSNRLQRSKLFKNDLVFAYVGTIGPVYLIEEDNKYHLGPNTSKISCGSEVSPEFLFCYFTSSFINKEIIEHTSIGAQPSLSMFKIRSFRIILPTIEEQKAIAKILSDIDKEIEKLEAKKIKYQAIKQGMMQELLTGKTRLI